MGFGNAVKQAISNIQSAIETQDLRRILKQSNKTLSVMGSRYIQCYYTDYDSLMFETGYEDIKGYYVVSKKCIVFTYSRDSVRFYSDAKDMSFIHSEREAELGVSAAQILLDDFMEEIEKKLDNTLELTLNRIGTSMQEMNEVMEAKKSIGASNEVSNAKVAEIVKEIGVMMSEMVERNQKKKSKFTIKDLLD